MVANTTSNSEFAQTGYIRAYAWSTSTTYYFFEYGDSSIAYAPVMAGVDSKGWGSSDVFTTYYDSGQAAYRMEINGYTVGETSLDWSADNQEWSAETYSNADYVMGGTHHHSVFGSNQYLYNGVWYNINTSSGLMFNSIVNGAYSNSGATFYIWDKRVS